MINLSTIIETHAKFRGSREAIVFPPTNTRLTYMQLDMMSCQVANALISMGIQPGDKVALTCPNLPYFPIIYFGILKAGAVVVPLNVLLKPREIAYHLINSDAKVYFCFEGTQELPTGSMGKAAFDEVATCEDFVIMTSNPASPSPFEGVHTLGQLLATQTSVFDTIQRSPEDTAVILYTSGTTGQPKGAELTHNNMLMNAIVSRDLHGIGSLEIPNMLVVLPLFHSFGQTCQMNAGLYNGGRIVLLPRFEPKSVLETMAIEEVTHFSGVPTIYWALLNYVLQNNFDLSKSTKSLKLCSSGASAMPVELLNQFDKTFGVTILEGYGLSETSPVATFNQLDLPRKIGSIGLPIQGVDIRIVDATGNDVATDELGEIVIRGHNIMKGYYKNPEATKAAFRDGWFYSGDVGRKDANGYIYIVDRVKDMVNRGGFSVYPREVEEVIATHPQVSLVAVVGVPHEVYGEEIKAYVIRKKDAQLSESELIEWCKDTMASYKYPRQIEFRDSLPMTATGKILKRELQQRSSTEIQHD
ncbi:MAG: long-chain fatty acid--CoA ligase [Anaerolineae bacterium]|nr:long-chain fatty acid--CoA ligase [Anaerolineae bacterium]